MSILLEITQQQVLQALSEADSTSLQLWIAELSAAAGYHDPHTGQILCPGFKQLLRAHGTAITTLQVALQGLPPSYLSALALFLANHGRYTPARRHHHPKTASGPPQDPVLWTDP